MKLEIVPSNQFKKDLKLVQKRGLDLSKLSLVISSLANGDPLDPKFKDHQLIGDYLGFRECHVAPDWLLIYKIDNGKLLLFLARTGSHSDIF